MESKDKRYILEISIKLRKRGIGDLSVKKMGGICRKHFEHLRTGGKRYSSDCARKINLGVCPVYVGHTARS